MRFFFDTDYNFRQYKSERGLGKQRILLIFSGILLGISFPPFPMPFTLVMFFALVPYFIVIEEKDSLLEINRATYLTFFIFSLITLYWVGSWQKAADPFLMMGGGLLLFVNPALFLIPSTLYYFTRRMFNSRAALFLFPAFWVTYEYLFMITDLNFPWLTLGSGLAHFTAFIQLADHFGAVGLSVIVLFINIFLYYATKNFNERKDYFYGYAAAALILFTAVLIYGYVSINSFKVSSEKLRVGVVQPNLDPWDKWKTGSVEDITKDYLAMSAKLSEDDIGLLIWPETAVPAYLLSGPYSNTVDSIYEFLQRENIFLLTGMPDARYYSDKNSAPSDVKYSEQGEFYYATYNSILLLSPNTRLVQRYGKMKLVPFGERAPFVDKIPFLENVFKWGVGISGWNVGKDTILFKIPSRGLRSFNKQPELNTGSTQIDTIKINGVVCFESVFPYLINSFVRKGAGLIVVVTNDSWYGRSSGPYQHKEISVLRAVENRRSVVRSANGGISCVINPLGETEIETELFTRSAFTADVSLEQTETFFSKYPMIIPILASAVSLWIFGLFLMKKIKSYLDK